jgi:putative phage-type endonuclease
MSLTREQLQERKGRLGASETAAALGLSPWCTPLELWQAKTSEVISELVVPNEFIEWGNRLEAAILAKYCDVHGVTWIEAPAAWRVSTQYPWLGCTPDALLDDRVVEIKTASTGRDWGEPGTDEIPAGYLVQVTQQMLVCGHRRADVAVLISGHDYREYSIAFDDELAKELIDRSWVFWQYVQQRVPPEPSTLRDAARRWPRESPGLVRIADDRTLDAVFALRAIKETQSKLEHEADELGLELRKFLGDAATLTDPDGRALATWKAQNRTTFDSTEFKKADPQRWAEFARTSASRVFRLSTE